MSQTETKEADVLPDWANSLMGLLWISLFGVRWVIFNLLNFAGLLSLPQIAELDRTLLMPIYLLLFGITLIVLALRLVRRSRSESSDEDAGQAAQPQTARTPIREKKPRD